MILAGKPKAQVVDERATYSWTSSYGTDHVKPIELLIESRPLLPQDYHWVGHTCWWEFSQDSDMLLENIWWK